MAVDARDIMMLAMTRVARGAAVSSDGAALEGRAFATSCSNART
jgi:hypothetical protein